MRIAYVLLSSTFGMHQYTADLAHEMVRAGHDVHLVTTSRYPADRYGAGVRVHTPLTTEGTGFSRAGLRGGELAAALRTLSDLDADVVHITGAHLWNLYLIWRLQGRGVPVVCTLHDLDPHPGVRHGGLIRLWNQIVVRTTRHLLVHGATYRQRLLARGRKPENVTTMPLSHLFMGDALAQELAGAWPQPAYDRWALFFGRLEAYKGVPNLLAAGQHRAEHDPSRWLVLAGQGDLEALWESPVPAGVEVRNRWIGDREGVELFAECGVVVLPYTGASQSALVAAAYAFGKPVIVTDNGALAEYVEPGVTGWVVPADDAAALEEALEMALRDRGRLAEMGAAGRRWYEEQRQQVGALLMSTYLQAMDQQTTSQRTRPQAILPSLHGSLQGAPAPIYSAAARR